MSLRARLVSFSLRTFEKPRLARIADPADLRAGFERKARRLFRPPRGTVCTHGTLGGVPVLRVRPPGAADPAPVIFYLHGGGYVFGSARTHMAMVARLAHLAGAEAVLVDYRLAPEHRFPAAFEDAEAAWSALPPTGAPVWIGGDSAGGGLALALLAQLLARGGRLPDAVFAFSPLTDLGFTAPSLTENSRTDAMLPAGRAAEMADLYLQGADPADPRASPLLAEFSGAPPVWMALSKTEILRDDALRMERRLRGQGVMVDLEIAPDLPHVWPFFQGLMPEAHDTLARLAGWLRQPRRS